MSRLFALTDAPEQNALEILCEFHSPADIGPALDVEQQGTIYHDRLFAEVTFGGTKEDSTKIILAHLEKLYSSAPGNKALTHGIYAMCHHGSIENPDLIPLAPAFKKRVIGNTDTEKLFQYIIQLTAGLKTPKAIRRALVKAVLFVREHCSYAALNIVFSNGRFLWGVREVNMKHEVVKTKKLLDYFSLFHGKGEDLKTHVICSNELPLPGILWEKLANHTLFEIDTKTLRTEVMKL